MLTAESLTQDHFELLPGLHATRALDCAAYFSPPTLDSDCRLLADMIAPMDGNVTAVVAASLCGHMMAAPVAARLTEVLSHPVRFVSIRFDDPHHPRLMPGYRLGEADRVAVVFENVLRGERIRPVIRLIREHRAMPVVVGVFLDRRKADIDLAVPLVALLDARPWTFDLAAGEICSFCGTRELCDSKVA